MAKNVTVVYNNPHNITQNVVQNFVNHGANDNAPNNEPSFSHKVAICKMLTKHVNYQKELLKDFQTMFSQTWRRPKEVTLPVVWCRFGRTNKNGKEFKFSIQTATDEHHDEMLDIMVKHFLTEATFKATAGCHKSPQYIKTIKGLIRNVVFPQNVSLVCVLEEESFANGSGKGRTVGQVVGYNMCAVCRDGEDLDFSEIMKTEAGEKTIKIYREVGNRLPSVHEKYCVREYLGSMGLCVVPDYRGMALAQEMLLSRISLCKEIGVKVTSALFTTKASILGAMDAGFAEDGSVAYADLEKTLGFKFIANCDSCKLLSYQIKQ